MSVKEVLTYISVFGLSTLATWTFGRNVMVSENYHVAFHPSQDIISSCGFAAHFQQMGAQYPASHFASFVETNDNGIPECTVPHPAVVLANDLYKTFTRALPSCLLAATEVPSSHFASFVDISDNGISECTVPHPAVVVANDFYKAFTRALPSSLFAEEDLIAPEAVYNADKVFAAYVQHRKKMGTSSFWSHWFVVGLSAEYSFGVATFVCVVSALAAACLALFALTKLLYPLYQDRHGIAFDIVQHRDFAFIAFCLTVFYLVAFCVLCATGHVFYARALFGASFPLGWMGWTLYRLAKVEYDKWLDGYRLKRAKHCAVLGVDLNASKAEIQKAYKAQALKWHPDKNRPGCKEMMPKVNAARDFLKGRNVLLIPLIR